jgi:hypothetical protein
MQERLRNNPGAPLYFAAIAADAALAATLI